MSFSQPALGPLVSADLTGRVVLVTGANTGLGLAASKHLATMNPAKLIMAVRSRERGEKALQGLVAETGFQRAEIGLVDFASFESVKTFVQKVVKENERLDLLLENAAVAVEDYALTEDGWESSLQVNVLGPEYLAFLLLPLMQKTATAHPETVPRITVVASSYHDATSLDEEVIGAESPLELMNGKEYSSRIFPRQEHILAGFPTMLARRYADVKLFNIYFVRELQKLLKNITVNSINPGLCVSELRRNTTGERAKALDEVVNAVAYTSEEGARCLVYALVAEQEKEEALRGQYLSLMEVAETSPFSNSKEGQSVQHNIWREAIDILSKVDSGVVEILKSFGVTSSP